MKFYCLKEELADALNNVSKATNSANNIEILRGISGTIGIILAVPFVSFIGSLYLKPRENIKEEESCLISYLVSSNA